MIRSTHKISSSVRVNIVRDEKQTQETFDPSVSKMVGPMYRVPSLSHLHGWVARGNSHVHEIVLFNLPRFDVSANADFSSNSHGSTLLVFTVRFTLSTVCFPATLELA